MVRASTHPTVMAHPLELKLAEAWPPADWVEVTVVVAVSGGCDSVALLRAMAALKTGGAGGLHCAHLNHHLRPEADADERFVVELCSRLSVPCHVGHASAERLATDSGDGLEAAARTARYAFLQEIAAAVGARFVAVAHTANDQAETILHRILRGTGIRGLAGMARARPLGHATLVRPLLSVHRNELAGYLADLGQPCCEDESNRSQRFTRNRIRLDTLPRLSRQYNRALPEALLRLGELAGEAQAVIDQQVGLWFDRAVSIEGPEAVLVDLAQLVGQPSYLIRELLLAVWRRQNWPLQSLGRSKLDELGALAQTTASPRRTFPGGISVEVVDRRMRLSKG